MLSGAHNLGYGLLMLLLAIYTSLS